MLNLIGASVTDNPQYARTDAIFGASSIVPIFSPVTIMESVHANAGSSYDVFANESGNITVGCGFYIQDTAATHQCIGARGVWVGPATTLRTTLWKYTAAGTATRVTFTDIPVASGASAYVEFKNILATPTTLLPGVFYAITIYDTAGLNYTGIGQPAYNNSVLAYMLPANNSVNLFAASSVLSYAVATGETGEASPFSTNCNPGSGDAQPIYNNSTSKYIPIEPIIT